MSTDPRFARSRDAILRAVVDIVQTEGPGFVTHQHVADRAGVGRATIYRHWPRPADLLFEAIEQVDLPFLEEAPGTLRERLRADLRRMRDDLSTAIVPALITTVLAGAQREGPYRARRDRVISNATANMRAAVERGVASGELDAAADPELLVAQVLGALLFRRLFADAPATDEFIDQIVDAALAPWARGD